MRAFSSLLALACFCSPAAATAAFNRVSTESSLAAGLSMPLATSLTGTPDAALFAWVVDRAGARNLWVGGPKMPGRKLTDFADDDGMQIYDLSFSQQTPRKLGDGYAPAVAPDGKRVAFVSQGTLYISEASGRTAPVKLAVIAGRLGTPQWSPDGRSLLVVDNRGDHSLIVLIDATSRARLSRSRFYAGSRASLFARR